MSLNTAALIDCWEGRIDTIELGHFEAVPAVSARWRLLAVNAAPILTYLSSTRTAAGKLPDLRSAAAEPQSLLRQSGLAQTDEEGSFGQEADFLRPPNTVGPQVGNAR